MSSEHGQGRVGLSGAGPWWPGADAFPAFLSLMLLISEGWWLQPGVVTATQACRDHLVFVLMHRWSKELIQHFTFLCSEACPGSLNTDFSLRSLSSLLALEKRTFFDILSN